jgi:hypothetical protein
VLTARLISERSLEELLRSAIDARAEGLVVLRDRDGLRHGLWVEAGHVVGIHVAGRFDPLLELLMRGGTLDARAHRACVEALYASGDRSGVVAGRVAGVPSQVVREALKQQLVARFVALLELAESAGYDAQLEPGPVPGNERTVRLPLGSLLRRAERVWPDARARVPEEAGRDAARRALRSLAKTLHPDLHPHLDAETRARLSAKLASATAAYHGFSRQ